MGPMSDKIYKIVGQAEWEKAEANGVFRGAEIDLQDGFIHFSAQHQVKETAAKHFAERDDLLLVTVASDDLGEALKWEISRGGDLFPHLYSELDLKDVSKVVELRLDEAGNHSFPF